MTLHDMKQPHLYVAPGWRNIFIVLDALTFDCILKEQSDLCVRAASRKLPHPG